MLSLWAAVAQHAALAVGARRPYAAARMNDRKKIDIGEISALVTAGARHAWAEKEPVALIGLLAGAVMAAVFWPAVRLNFTAMQLTGVDDPALTEAFVRDALAIWPLYLLMLLFNSAVTVVVARLAVLGRSETLSGGVPALMRRLVWMLWRNLGAVGWIMVGAAMLWLATSIIGIPLSLIVGDGNMAALLQTAFVLLLSVGIVFLFGAMGLSLISECADRHLTIRHAWGLLKGQRAKLAGALLGTYLVTAVANSLLLALAPENAGGADDMRLLQSVLHVVVTIVGTFLVFFWFSMTAIVAKKIDWEKHDHEQAAI